MTARTLRQPTGTNTCVQSENHDSFSKIDCGPTAPRAMPQLQAERRSISARCMHTWVSSALALQYAPHDQQVSTVAPSPSDVAANSVEDAATYLTQHFTAPAIGLLRWQLVAPQGHCVLASLVPMVIIVGDVATCWRQACSAGQTNLHGPITGNQTPSYVSGGKGYQPAAQLVPSSRACSFGCGGFRMVGALGWHADRFCCGMGRTPRPPHLALVGIKGRWCGS
jgi:hypothetical protein